MDTQRRDNSTTSRTRQWPYPRDVGDADGTETFTGRRTQATRAVLLAVAILLLGLLLKDMAKRITPIVDIYMGVVAAGIVVLIVGFVRAFRIGVTLDAERIIARSAFSTRSWRWEQVDGADAIERHRRGVGAGLRMNPSAWRATAAERYFVVPVIRLTSGRQVVLNGLSAMATTDIGESWTADAVHEINARLERRRGSGPQCPTPS